jgi:hypothetical protein
MRSISETETFLSLLRTHLSGRISRSDAERYNLEGTFFKKQILPNIHSFLCAQGLRSDRAKESLLAEGYQDPFLKEFVSGTPASKPRYPFKKGILRALNGAKKEWWEKGKGLHASCPDAALGIPYNVVFEGKLFRQRTLEAAKSAIVNGVYEYIFYRGLPTLLDATEQSAAGYDYACLLAYDASKKQLLNQAWDNVEGAVKSSCWEDLHVYVMILPEKGA